MRRQQMLSWLLKSTNLANELHNYSLAIEHSKLRLNVPPEIYQKLNDGSWSLKNAKDGSGFLPIVVNGKDGKFSKQIRLEWTSDNLTAKTELANLAAHAKTHALLKQVIAKLDKIDAKLDLVLENQRADWQGKIYTGLQIIERVSKNKRPLDQYSMVRLATAEQSIREGYNTGIGCLSNNLNALTNKPILVQYISGLFTKKPSEELAKKLDEVADDVKVLASGVRGLITNTILLDNEESTQQEVLEFAEKISETFKRHNKLIRKATFDSAREHFWTQYIPALANQSASGDLVIEFEPKECLCIDKESRNRGNFE